MRTISFNAVSQYTAIPNAFIDTYLPKANPMYSVIFIYFYRHCMSGACAVTTAGVAESFGILETDVVNCLKYWEKTGMIRLSGAGEEYNIAFVSPEAAVPLAVVEKAAAETATENAPAPAAAKTSPVGAAGKTIAIETRPVYTVDELELYKTESSDVARLFSMAEQAFGKLHHYNDLCVIFGIYDWLRLPLDVIEVLLTSCAASGHLNMRYVERVAVDWAERGICDADAAEAYVRMHTEGYREVMKALGRGGRAPAPKERQYLDKWLTELAMPLAVVLEACDRTIMNTDKRVFAYCDKIITDWHAKGVATLEDVTRVSAAFSAAVAVNGGSATVPQRVAPRKPTRFANFKQREWDFSEVERVERAYLELGKA